MYETSPDPRRNGSKLRLTALEARLEALSQLGRNDEVLGDALAMARDHPLRERVQGLAMLALYRAGRQTEALDLYVELRRRLDDELGLEPSAELRELQRRILEQDPELDPSVPPVDATSALPVPPNLLVGRERDLEALAELLSRRDPRLLVLTGAGGSGKTRLALAAARQAASSFANGAVIVELAPLRDPELLLSTIASAIGVAEVPSQTPLDTLAAAVSNRELLVVLDNVEHLRSATPSFVELLARAPRLVLLVTSRAVLHLTGEHVFPVSPLDDDAAVELFEQRARALQSDFEVTAENEGVVREICGRVDGLPLAIELAAAWIRSLTPSALLERLEQRLTVLTGGPRPTGPPADAPRGDRLERRAPDRRRANGARPAVGARGRCDRRGRGSGLRNPPRRALDADRSSPRPAHGHAGRIATLVLETIHEYAAELLVADPRAPTGRVRVSRNGASRSRPRPSPT